MLAILAVGVSGAWLSEARRTAVLARAERRAHQRAPRAEAATTEAGLEEPAFAPANVRHAIEHLLALGETVWRGGRTELVSRRSDRAAIEAWARGWQATLGPDVRLVGRPKVDVLRVVNRAGEDEDRLVARVRWQARRRPLALAEHLDERWTLGRHGRTVVLLATGGDPLSGAPVTGELIPDAVADTDRFREQSLRELAEADATPAKAQLAELTASGADPDAALADIGLIDGRYAAVVVEAALRHLIETWEEASTGSDRPLREVASTEAASMLLHTPRGRLRIRDVQLVDWHCTALTPPRLQLAVRVRGVAYLVAEDSGGYVAGDDVNPSMMRLRWAIELTPAAPTDWLLVTTSDPAARLSGG